MHSLSQHQSIHILQLVHCFGELPVPKIKKTLIEKLQICGLGRTSDLQLIVVDIVSFLNIFVEFCSSEGQDTIGYELCLIGIEIDRIVAEIAAILDPVVQIFPSFGQLSIQFSLTLHSLLLLPTLLYKHQLVIFLPHHKFLYIQ